jgi:hypothetical protein
MRNINKEITKKIEKNGIEDLSETDLKEVKDIYQIVDIFLLSNRTMFAIGIYKKYYGCSLTEASDKVIERSNQLYAEGKY